MPDPGAVQVRGYRPCLQEVALQPSGDAQQRVVACDGPRADVVLGGYGRRVKKETVCGLQDSEPSCDRDRLAGGEGISSV